MSEHGAPDRPVGGEADAPPPAGPAEVVETEVLEAEVVDPGFETGDAESLGDEGELLLAELTAAQAELDEYRDTLQRLKADFDNYKKRVIREQTALVERASADLVRELLPVLDAFEAALAAPLEGERVVENLRSGLAKVWEQLTGVLGNTGLDRIADTGVIFDPARHEAVVSEGPVQSGGPTVEEVLRSGWALRGQVLRPAMVKVRG